jgi:chemotaxis protein methyltransferase CheR
MARAPVAEAPVVPLAATAAADEPVAGPDPFEAAMACYEQGSYAEATGRLEEMSRRRSLDASEMVLLARSLANQGRLADALAWCNRAVAAEKLSPSCHYLRATILHEQGALDEAARALRRAIYLDHKFVVAHFALGNLARVRGRFAEADRHFVNALHLLREHDQDDILPESEGMTAGRLAETITATMAEEAGT